MKMETLPDDLGLEIFKKLPFKDFTKMLTVCKSTQGIMCNYKNLLLKSFITKNKCLSHFKQAHEIMFLFKERF